MDSLERVMPKAIEFDEDASTDTYGRFIAEPLERGFGVTLGNSLRRVLLSSLPGSAFVTVKFDGVQHEFSTMPKVKEDVTDICFQFKQVRLKYDGEEPKVCRVEAEGPTVVTAKDIEAGPEVEILNPDLKIATVDKGGTFVAELTIERGRGYVPAEFRRGSNGESIGVIHLDAVYSPIVKANFLVEETRVGQRTDYDKLLLELWTDGSVSPDEALRNSATILIDHLTTFSICGKPDEGADEEGAGEGALDESLLKSISDFELSVRAANCLKSSQILLIGDLVQKTEPEMMKFKNFGRKSLMELKELLEGMGLEFGMTLSDSTQKALEARRKELLEDAASQENE